MKGIARAALKGVKRPDLLQTRAYLKGDWLSKQQTIAVLDPATGEELAQVAACSVSDVDEAVSFARTTFLGWRDVLP
ncbi:MAG: aldehyde dehydrogenase, partial [Mesorhizobium sp.]